MSSPIVPGDIPSIAASGDGCSRFNALLRLPIQFKQFLTWLLTTTGEISDAVVQSISDRLTPVGGIIIWPAPSLPSASWLICNGQPISRTDYPILFQRISTIYGAGDSSTTFNLPDYQALFLRGAGPSQGLGVAAGLNTVTLTEANLPAHKHSTTFHRSSPDTGPDTLFSTGNDNGGPDIGDYPDLTLDTSETGDNESFSIIPANKAVYWIIKAK